MLAEWIEQINGCLSVACQQTTGLVIQAWCLLGFCACKPCKVLGLQATVAMAMALPDCFCFMVKHQGFWFDELSSA